MNKAITIGAAVMMSLSLAACGSNSSTSSRRTATIKKAASAYHKVGETVKVGKVTYTLKSVEVTSERNEFADNQPKNVIKVVYHVKNNSDKDLPIGTDLEAYGPDNTKLKSYPISNTTLDSVAAGKEADVTTGFGADKLGTFELHFSPLISTEKPVKFRVKVKASSSNENSSNSSSIPVTTSNSQSQVAQSNNQPNNVNQSATQATQASSNSADNSSDIHDFVNKYGESPAAYKMDHYGMSADQALADTPDTMKTSGELQYQEGVRKGYIQPNN